MELWMALALAFVSAVCGAFCARAARKRKSMPLLVAAVMCALACLGLVLYAALTLIFVSSI